MSAIKIARESAKKTFDAYLERNRSTAANVVPQEVIDAAQLAYRDAGGEKKIVVVGRGNATHPVCSVDVQIAK